MICVPRAELRGFWSRVWDFVTTPARLAEAAEAVRQAEAAAMLARVKEAVAAAAVSAAPAPPPEETPASNLAVAPRFALEVLPGVGVRILDRGTICLQVAGAIASVLAASWDNLAPGERDLFLAGYLTGAEGALHAVQGRASSRYC